MPLWLCQDEKLHHGYSVPLVYIKCYSLLNKDVKSNYWNCCITYISNYRDCIVYFIFFTGAEDDTPEQTITAGDICTDTYPTAVKWVYNDTLPTEFLWSTAVKIEDITS